MKRKMKSIAISELSKTAGKGGNRKNLGISNQ
jgi:hypothetical protein